MKTPATAAALSGRAGRTMKIPATARAGESVRPSCAEQPQPPHSSGRTAQTKKTPATAAALGRTDWADHEDSSHSRRTQRAGWADHEDTSNSSGGRVRPPELRGTATAAALKRTDCADQEDPSHSRRTRAGGPRGRFVGTRASAAAIVAPQTQPSFARKAQLEPGHTGRGHARSWQAHEGLEHMRDWRVFESGGAGRGHGVADVARSQNQ